MHRCKAYFLHVLCPIIVLVSSFYLRKTTFSDMSLSPHYVVEPELCTIAMGTDFDVPDFLESETMVFIICTSLLAQKLSENAHLY